MGENGGGDSPPPPGTESQTPSPENYNRKTHKTRHSTIHFGSLWRKHPPSNAKNIDTLPPPARSLPTLGV